MDRFEMHCHSEYSSLRLLDSINKIPKIADRAVKLGLKGIALTDHECLSGAPFIKREEKRIRETNPDFKFAIGNEIYLTNDRSLNQRYYHFILIAKNKNGYRALRELSSHTWMQSYYDRGMERVPTLKSELIEVVHKYPGSLIASSACLGSEVSVKFLNMLKAKKEGRKEDMMTTYRELDSFIKLMKRLFGNDFYIECAPGRQQDQIDYNIGIQSVAKYYGLKMIIGTDSHYLSKEDAPAHEAYLNSKGGEREVKSFYEYAYLQSEEDIVKNLQGTDLDYQSLCKNSMEVFDKIEDYEIEHTQTIPKVKVHDYPVMAYERWKNCIKEEIHPTMYNLFHSLNPQERYWVNEVMLGLESKGLLLSNYIDQCETEAKIIKHIGNKLNDCLYCYFNTFKHYIDLFWECGSMVCPGRGSVTGFTTCYALGITQVNPIKNHLYYWRFLNMERVELPDIDIDLCPSAKSLILQKIREERGQVMKVDKQMDRDNLGVTLVATFGTLSTRSVIQTSCFQKGTKVKTKNGYINIENIKKGDYVWTKNGWEQVINPTSRLWNGNFIEIEADHGFEEKIICTDTHEFMTVNSSNKGHRLVGEVNTKTISKLVKDYKDLPDTKKTKYRNWIRDIEEKWVECKNLKPGDFLLKKIDQNINDIPYLIKPFTSDRKHANAINNKILLDNYFYEWIGMWCAEGSFYDNHICFTINNKETDLLNRIIFLTEKIFGLKNPSIQERKENHKIIIQYSSVELRDFFYFLFEIKDHSEINQWNMRVPKILMNGNPCKQLQLFKGWLTGDGTARIRKNQKWNNSCEFKGVSVSKQLAIDIKEILNRNYINPSFMIEKRENRKNPFYNIVLSGKVAKKCLDFKYNISDKQLYFEMDERLGKDLPCFINGQPFMRYKIKSIKEIKNKKEQVYCLQVKSQSFTVSDIIVHNCRGYRSEEYPNGISNDIALYLGSLVPKERGFLWSLNDLFYGNEENGREPNKLFINEVSKYPGLKDILFKLEGLIIQRGSHASGVIMFDEDPYEFGAFMKTPSGDIITQFDLHTCESLGLTKFDFLVTDVQDKLVQFLELLTKDHVIPKDTLRNQYNAILHPDIIDIKNPKIWKALGEGSVLDCFQFSTGQGLMIAKKLKPQSLTEMTDANTVMRLMAPEGKEQPMDKYARFKKNILLWYKEMEDAGLTEEQVHILEPHYKPSYGCPPAQEHLMSILLDEKIANFTLTEANEARKIVGKKKMKKIPYLKNKIFKAMEKVPKFAQYIWETGILPQLGYAFSVNHSFPYSYVGVQTLVAGVNYNPIYWNTACLIVNSGSLEDKIEHYIDNDGQKKKIKSTDYGKIGKAIGEIQKHGIKVSSIDINKSEIKPVPDVENNQILYGMKALNGVGDDIIKSIIINRPYFSFDDFINKTKLTASSVVPLIKSGAFDKIEKFDRVHLLMNYCKSLVKRKKNITFQNMNTLLEKNLIPQEYSECIKIWKFQKYLNDKCKWTLKEIKEDGKCKNTQYYKLDKLAFDFFERNFDASVLEYIDNSFCIKQKTKTGWDGLYYQPIMKPLKEYFINNVEELIESIYRSDVNDIYLKYSKGTNNISAWEMQAMSFYQHEHELKNIDISKYGLSDFEKLPEEPVPEKFFKKKDKNIPIYHIDRIAGTVIDKNKDKHIVTLLTTSGVVDCKFSGEFYAMFDKQISEQIRGKDKKEVKEKSWFSRGNMLIVSGIREGDVFRGKVYKRTNAHQLYKIDKVTRNNELVITSHRYGEELEYA